MIKKSSSKFPKNYIHEHLDRFLKSTMEERLIWLTKANKMARQLQKATARAH